MLLAQILAALAFASAAAMAGYLASRPQRGEVHRLLLSLCAAVGLWTGGAVIRHLAGDHDGLFAGLVVIFLGLSFAPPLWLLLAVRYSGSPALADRSGARALLFVPSCLMALAVLTNPLHGAVFREISSRALETGPRAWAGPVFWIFIVWVYGLVLAGSALHLRTARRMAANAERRRGLALAVAALVPVATSGVYLSQLVRVRFDFTPASLIVSMALISLAMLRYRLLEGLPLARRDVIEHLRDGVVIAGVEGSVVDVNPAAEALLGSNAESLRGRALDQVLADCAPGEGGGAAAALCDGGAQGAAVAREIATRDGRRLEVRVARVRGASGEPAGRIAVLRDRTEERRAERVARQSEKLETLGTLAGGVAHELNNPLAFIRCNLNQILAMSERVEEARAAADGAGAKLAAELADLREIACESLDGIRRIERIVHGMRLLQPAREAGFEALDVDSLVRDALRRARLDEAPEVVVEVELAGGLQRVEGSSERLVQVLLNLISNARLALASGGTLRVETAGFDGGVEIHVRDDGPGISEAIRERIFDPFFTTRDPDQGSGLGLAIAFDVVRDHGGSLELLPTEGRGACFRVRLPARERPALD